MTTRGSLWLPLVVLALLAALSFWIERSVQFTDGGKSRERTDPEGIMENFNALRTDVNGQPQYRLSAKRLKHYTSSKLTEMEAPRFVLLEPASGEVTVQAREATVSPDGTQVDLRGDVVAVRAANGNQSALTLRTARLLVYPERNLLRAPGTVEIEDATMKMRAGALEYDTARRAIKVTKRVQARYNQRK